MTKTEFVRELSRHIGLSIAKTGEIVDTYQQLIINKVAEGEEVTFTGFGKFEQGSVKERSGHNPKTREPLVIPAHKKPKFTPGKVFKETVKGTGSRAIILVEPE